MFGGLAGALMFDYYREKSRKHALTLRAIIAFAASTAAFGVVDEVVQGALGIGRASDPFDLVADVVGIIVASFTAPPLIRAIIHK